MGMALRYNANNREHLVLRNEADTAVLTSIAGGSGTYGFLAGRSSNNKTCQYERTYIINKTGVDLYIKFNAITAEPAASTDWADDVLADGESRDYNVGYDKIGLYAASGTITYDGVGKNLFAWGINKLL